MDKEAEAAAQPENPDAARQLRDLKERFLAEIDSIVAEPSESSYWDLAGKQIPDRITAPDNHLTGVRRKLDARIKMLNRDDGSNEPGAEVFSFARVPGAPSAPVRGKIFTAGLAGGFLFAFLLAVLFRK